MKFLERLHQTSCLNLSILLHNQRKKNSELFIIVEDDGPGIPKKEHENVFKPFYKIDKARSDSKSSVGLGLSIASDIIQSHGGNITLRNRKPHGLQAEVSLPIIL